MQKTLAVTITTAFALALLSCSELRRPAEQPSTTGAMVYERAGSVVRAPLAPPVGYSSPSPRTDSPTPLAPYVNPNNESIEPQTTGLGEWRASPRWAAIKGDGCIEVEPAEGEAGKVRVENCSKDDVGVEARGEAFGQPPE
jgi:hypothetical protein